VIALLLMGCTNDERFSGAPSSRGVAQAYEPACYDASNKAVWDLGQATPLATSFTPINRIVLADSGVAGVGNVRVLRLNGTGQALIVDTPNRDLKWIDLPSGDVTHVIGRSGRGPGEFRAPFDASITPSGRILVADPEVGRISLFTTDGEYLEEFAITHQDPRIIIAHSDSDYSVIGQSGAG